jgi:O-antigen/teichoic acid export membrane protein
MAARYVPEFRLKGPGPRLRWITERLLLWQLAALSLVAAIALSVKDVFLAWLKLSDYAAVAAIYVFVFVAEGVARFVREGLLGPLLQQGIVQVSVTLRNVSMVIIVLVMCGVQQVQLTTIAWAELAATCVGAVVGLGGLALRMRQWRKLPGDVKWREPQRSVMWRIALRMYGAHMLALLHSPQALILLLQRTIGGESVALFGFLRNLWEHVARYLPATLLFSLVRPKLVACYVDGGSIRELERNANLVGMLSLFVLIPIITASAISGSPLVAVASDGKFVDAGPLLVGFMFGLVPFSQRQLMETAAVATGNSDLCVRAALVALLALPMAVVMVSLGAGVWSGVVALGLGHALFSVVILAGLKGRTGYRLDRSGALKLFMLGIITFFIIRTVEMVSSIGYIAAIALTFAVYLMLGWVVKPFTDRDRSRINKFVRRRVFVW